MTINPDCRKYMPSSSRKPSRLLLPRNDISPSISANVDQCCLPDPDNIGKGSAGHYCSKTQQIPP